MINKETIRDDQYKNAGNLQARISIHQNYTRNYTNFWPKIAEQYPWESTTSILEFGCGTGVFWESATSNLKTNTKVLLTDISAGMLEQTKKSINDSRFEFKVSDIDNAIFTDKFDLILCHFMLYYSENTLSALQKIKKLISPNGKIMITTLGENHMQRFDLDVKNIIENNHLKVNITNQANAKRFTEDTADKEINQVFDNVRKIEIDDYLDITAVEPIIAYCKSTMRFGEVEGQIYNEFKVKIQEEIENNGKYVVQKRVVLYICS